MASRSWGQLATGHPGFTMPAFSPAMAATVSPSKSVWSSPMRQITLASDASMTLVASSRPPRPTSNTTISQTTARKCSKATAAMSSNSVG